MLKATRYFILSLTFSVSMLFTVYCYGSEVVRANFTFQGDNKPIDITLFDNISNTTVLNFLSYIDDGSYNSLIVNRSVSGSIIQSGAYTFNQLSGDGTFSYAGNDIFNGGLQPVSSKGSVSNEFKLSNLRGTIAMAKIPGQVDSASNQWFINLSDNSFLDTANGGFTVFGKILGNGLDTLDTITTIPIYDLSSELNINNAFISVPLIDYTAGSTISEISDNNLVKITSFDRLFSITDILDFGDAIENTTTSGNIVIHNYNSTPLQIGAIDISSISAPFSITTCQNKLLQKNEECVLQIEFNPTSSGFFLQKFNIEVSTYGYTFPVTLQTPSPEIRPSPDIVAFGAQPINPTSNVLAKQKIIYIYNDGDRTLNISSISFDTPSPNEFEFIDNCTTNSQYPLGNFPPGAFCILVVNYTPLDLFEKSATISIASNDPTNSLFTIPVTGGATTDNDGIDNSIEDAAPNNGDNNNDGLPDRLQNNITSFTSPNGSYTTLITDSNLAFTKVEPVLLSSLPPLTENLILKNEAFSFELSGLPIGSIAQFGLILPEGVSPAKMHSFGPTTEDNTQHWYTLNNNTSPGITVIGSARLTSPSGISIVRNLSIIQIIDGGYGDSDLLANGKIVFVGGVETNSTNTSKSGSVLWILLAMFTISVFRKCILK